METIELIQLYLDDNLPSDITLTYVPIEKTGYGDYQIVRDIFPTQSRNSPIGGTVVSETVYLEEYRMGETVVFAGYEPNTKILIVGKEAT